MVAAIINENKIMISGADRNEALILSRLKETADVQGKTIRLALAEDINANTIGMSIEVIDSAT